MPSVYQKRVQKIVIDFPMKLRFKMFLENLANGIDDPLVLGTGNDEERIEWAKMIDRFYALGFLYSFKRCMQTQDIALNYRTILIQTLKSHIALIGIVLKLVDLTKNLNSRTRDETINQMCLKVEERLKEDCIVYEEVLSTSSKEIEAFSNTDTLLEATNKRIIELESEFGIEHPLKKYLIKDY